MADDKKIEFKLIRKHIEVEINGNLFRISVNKFDELVINKADSTGDGNLIVIPNYSNQIIIK